VIFHFIYFTKYWYATVFIGTSEKVTLYTFS